MKRTIYIFLFATLSFLGCNQSTASTKERDQGRDYDYSDNEDEGDESECGYDDDTYSATVDYYNPNTSTTATYTLNVVVEDCQVTEIDFPSGGYLDDSHIDPADLDDDGNASLEDEEGRTYDVHIDE